MDNTEAETMDNPAIRSILVLDTPIMKEEYVVGENGVTKIEAFMQGGLHCDIPYVRVFKNDKLHSEFCQHAIIGVYFEL